MAEAIFLVGAPGVGKTTLARAILDRLSPGGLVLHPKPKWTLGGYDAVCAAGHYTGSTFDGADTVPYNGVREAIAYWRDALAHRGVTLFDGDRFSDARTFEEVLAVMPARIVLVQAPDALLAERRLARGSNQNAAWMRGRATKAERFAKLDPSHMRLPASEALQWQVSAVLGPR